MACQRRSLRAIENHFDTGVTGETFLPKLSFIVE
jgi:hypothetical protein